MKESFKNLKKHEKILLLIFVLIETILFLTFQFKLSITIYLQYASIVLCFVFSLYFAKKSNFNLFVSAALFFTICADYVLLFLSEHKMLGLLFFCIVQIVYFFYINKQTNRKQTQANLWTRLVTIIILEVSIWLIFKNIFNILAGLVIFYFVNLLYNTIFAQINFRKNPLFAIGLVFFVLCDIFVGFGQINLFFDVSSSAFFDFVYSIPFNIAWTFYIPSQVFISIGNIVNSNQ